MAENIETIANEVSETSIKYIQACDGSLYPIVDTKNTTGASEFQTPGRLHLVGATGKGEEEITYTKSGIHIHVPETGTPTLYSPGIKCETSTSYVEIYPGTIVAGTSIRRNVKIESDGTIDAVGQIRTTSGNIIADVGNITTGTGSISAPAGTITAGTSTSGVTIASDGTITATGNIKTGTSTSSVSIGAGGAIGATGDIETIYGNIFAKSGNIEAPGGNIVGGNIIAGTSSAGVTMSSDGTIKSTTFASGSSIVNVEISASGITTRGYIKSLSPDTNVEISPSSILVKTSTSTSTSSYVMINPGVITATGNIITKYGNIIAGGVSSPDCVTIAADGSITATNYIKTGSGGVGTTINIGGISTTGYISASGDIISGTSTAGVTIYSSGNINATGTITTSGITVGTITASGDISARGYISTSRAIYCANANVSSAITVGSTTSGVVIGSAGTIAATGTITAQAFYESSDERLKTFTEDYDINLGDIKNIRTGKFYWNSDENKVIYGGVTAQSVEKYFPELVREDENGTKTVNYDGLAGVALAAIKKLTAKVEELEDIIRNK